MNRVDEALRRARDFTPTLTIEDRIEEAPATQPGNPVPLDLYPAEGTPSVDAFPPVSLARRTEEARPRVAASHEFEPESALAFTMAPRIGHAYEGKLVTHSASVFSTEQYRRLAGAVHHLQGEQGLHRLMVSSSVPGEGKTLTIVNLAMTLSEFYQRRVLLIDADLRSPAIHDVFGITDTDGLCEVLQSEAREIHLAQVSERLWVLPAGSVQGEPVQLLASAAMASLLDDLSSQFDWILLDGPPVTMMAETGLLVRLTRAVILVVGAGSTPCTVVEKAVSELGVENIVGTVLNRIDEIPSKWSGYYGGSQGTTTSRRDVVTPTDGSSRR